MSPLRFHSLSRDLIGSSLPLPPQNDADLRLSLSLDLDLRLELCLGSQVPLDLHHKEADLETSSSSSCCLRSLKKRARDDGNESSEPPRDDAQDEDRPCKARVIGWPPIRSHRRHSLARSDEPFVKVNMDGVAVGRKIDLHSYSSYESLFQALEEMFRPLIAQLPLRISSARETTDSKYFTTSGCSDFVLTYEDKDHDWMLVGDVPWSMFISSVRRLRIARASETNRSASRQTKRPNFRPEGQMLGFVVVERPDSTCFL